MRTSDRDFVSALRVCSYQVEALFCQWRHKQPDAGAQCQTICERWAKTHRFRRMQTRAPNSPICNCTGSVKLACPHEGCRASRCRSRMFLDINWKTRSDTSALTGPHPCSIGMSIPCLYTLRRFGQRCFVKHTGLYFQRLMQARFYMYGNIMICSTEPSTVHSYRAECPQLRRFCNRMHPSPSLHLLL